jgi:hypothetical protein
VAAAVRAQVNRYGRATTWVIGVLAALAAVEAMGIWVLTQRQPPPGVARTETPGVAPAANTAALAEPPQTNPTTGPSEPAAPRPNAATKPPASISVQPLAPTTPPIDARAAAKTAAISGPVTAPRSAPVTRTGKLTISSPVELQVFMDGQLLGSSAAPLTVSEGAHQFEFVNAALDFRLARGVDVKRGLENLVEVPFPTGRLNINATPWAEVLIDGRAAGETPLANVTLPVGVHEIVFRHPELGERRQTVVVKTGPVLRVTQTFQIPLDLIAGGKR